jgi:hypothetical protein
MPIQRILRLELMQRDRKLPEWKNQDEAYPTAPSRPLHEKESRGRAVAGSVVNYLLNLAAF